MVGIQEQLTWPVTNSSQTGVLQDDCYSDPPQLSENDFPEYVEKYLFPEDFNILTIM